MADPNLTLPMHEDNSVKRTDAILSKLDELKGAQMDPVNVFASPAMGTGAALGGGLGGGVVGGLLANAFLGNGVLGRNGVAEGIVTPTLLTAELNRVQANTDAAVAANERLMTARFDADAQRQIESAIQSTSAATLLALANGNAALGVEVAKGQGEINTQVALTTGNLGTQNALNAAAIQTQTAKQTGDLSTQVALNTAAVATAVERTGTATALAFKDSAILAQANTATISQQLADAKYGLATAIKADGDQTRALISSINDANLNRMLTVAQNEITELRGDRNHNQRSQETELRITQNVTTNQNQIQAQAQQQQQLQLLGAIAAGLGNLTQIAHATNSNIIAGNTGATTTGAQSANPVNVRA